MKLFITHASTKYDPDMKAKKGIEQLIDYFPPEDTVELDNTENSWDSGCEHRRYITHQGIIRYSHMGDIKDEFVKELKNENEKEFILTGGYFDRCHRTTFLDLFFETKEGLFIFPLETIFSFDIDISKEKKVLKTIKKRYCRRAAIYWDNESVKKSRCMKKYEENCTIKIFTTNEKLFDYLEVSK